MSEGGPDMPSLSRLKAIEIMEQAEAITDDLLLPLNDAVLGPLEKGGEVKSRPYAFRILFGKSLFWKKLYQSCARKSKTELPTDDGFTVIAPSSDGKDLDQDGPALVGSPDAGFSGLRLFGPGLINHMHLKVRADLNLDGIMMIDSPGMIDSPANQKNNWDFQTTSRDRGYDFMGVTKWFADRADVILLFLILTNLALLGRLWHA